MIELSRREFVLVSGVAVLPGCELVSGVLVPEPATTLPAEMSSEMSAGRAASAELDFQSGTPAPRAWTARGGSHRLTLSATGVSIELPTRSPQTLSFDQLRMGVGHDTIRRFFGQSALSALLQLPGA